LLSRETNHGSFGEGFKTGITAGYRVSSRLGFEMGINYFKKSSKTMVETMIRLVATGPVFATGRAQGTISAFHLAPVVVFFFRRVKRF
jgi:hypothetical protein